MNKETTISILGCGWYGLPAGTSLVRLGYIVKGSTTRSSRFRELKAQGIIPYLLELNSDVTAEASDFFKCDVLIIAFPPRIGKEGVEEYLKKVKRLTEEIKRSQIKNVIFISSSSVYGSPNATVTEATPTCPDTDSARGLCQAEALLKNDDSFNTTILRFAGLVGPGRHPGLFLNRKGKLENGLAPVNLVHLNDCIGITEKIIGENNFGHIINVCSPDHPSRKAFYCLASLQAGREAPDFADELKEWKTVSSYIVPVALKYQYQIQDWMKALLVKHNWHL